MGTILNPKLTAFEAQAAANGFLLDHLPDLYCALEAQLDPINQLWRVPVTLTYPRYGGIGKVGEICVSVFVEKIVSFTPLIEMRTTARQLYDQQIDAIEEAFSGQKTT